MPIFTYFTKKSRFGMKNRHISTANTLFLLEIPYFAMSFCQKHLFLTQSKNRKNREFSLPVPITFYQKGHPARHRVYPG